MIQDILLSEHASPQTRLQAARDILDRLGWVPPKRVLRCEDGERELEEMSLAELEVLASGHNGIRLDDLSLQELADE